MSSAPATSPVGSTLLRSSDVALLLQVSEPTLSRWRSNGTGPHWVSLNGMARYREVDVWTWVEGQIR